MSNIQIPDEFEILNGKFKRKVLKRGHRCYLIEEKSIPPKTTKWIVMVKRIRGVTEILSDYQKYKLGIHKGEAEEIFARVESGEIVF